MSLMQSLMETEIIAPQYPELDHSIIEALENLALLSASLGQPLKPYSNKSKIQLQNLPFEKKNNILSQINKTTEIILTASALERIEPAPKSEYPCKRYVEQALNFYGYYIKDENFWNTLRHDEFIEIYNAENIQIFRTFNFFRTSSYSLLDLLTNEWFSLWERPTGTMEHMFKVVTSLFSGKITGIAPVGVPEHVINEIFNADDQENFEARSSLCKFGVVCAIYNKLDDKIGGLLVSARVLPVALGKETENISFI